MNPLDFLRRLSQRLSNRLLPSGSVVADTVRGGVWAGLTQVGSQGLEILRLLVLAAVLSPEDFGLMGIALLSLAAFEKSSRLGIQDALIYDSNDDVNEYLDTAWTMTILRGITIFTVLYLAAPYVAEFFGEPRATDLIRATALVPFLMGLQNPSVVYFKKDLQFQKLFVQRVSGSLAGATVAIGFAIVTHSVWALVFGVLTKEGMRLVASYLIDPYRPSLSLDTGLARELLGFGKWITGLNMVIFVNSQGDDIVVGWLLSASALGLYQFAYQISNTPATQVTNVVTSIMFPSYSKVQDDIRLLREGFIRTLKLVTVVTAPMAVGIALTIEPFLRGFIGEKWLPAVTVIQLLAVYGFLRSVGAMSGPLYKAVGRPDIGTKIAFVRLALGAILIYPMITRFNVEGAAAVVVGTSLLFAEPASYYTVAKILDVRLREFLPVFTFPLGAAAVMGLCLVWVRQSLTVGSARLEFVLLVLVGASVYGTLMFLLERQFDYGMRSIFRTVVAGLR